MDHLHDDGTAYYLREAQPQWRCKPIFEYNDSAQSYKAIRDLIGRARVLAETEIVAPVPLTHKRQWLPPAITAAAPTGADTEECASLAKLEAADARKSRLLAEIELERVARMAKGDTRLTYILCPEPPSNYHVSPASSPSIHHLNAKQTPRMKIAA
jgi:hypothetical protein